MPAAKTFRVIGRRTINAVWRIGMAARFFFLTIMYAGSSFRRFHLTVKELFSTGVMSLIIIIVAGLFVGMVLGLQGYETLKRYGSESALGSMVALSLVRELGPVVAALLFASRGRLGDDRGDRLDESDRANLRDGDDGGESDRAHRRAALLGRRDLHAVAGRDVQRRGGIWRLPGGCSADRRGRRFVLVADAGGSGFPR